MSKITFYQALADALEMMRMYEGLEPRSALKQAASDLGIPSGEKMREFVEWAENRLYS